MNVRNEIENYSPEDEKPALRWLFDRYHMQSEWRIVSICSFEGRYPNSHRIWHPSAAGWSLYSCAIQKEVIAELKETLEDIAGTTSDNDTESAARCALASIKAKGF